MRTIKELAMKGKIVMTIYTPETIKSSLAGNIDHFISSASSFNPVHRLWVSFTGNTVKDFYKNAEWTTDAAVFNCVAQIFGSGPSLVTFWEGENAFARMQQIKGATHPAMAGVDTIRGRFYCDNLLCNLMHSSDSYRDMYRELEVIEKIDVLDEEAELVPLINSKKVTIDQIYHSSIVTLYKGIKRYLSAKGIIIDKDLETDNDEAWYVFHHILGYLSHLSADKNRYELVSILGQFTRRENKQELLERLYELLPFDNWEQLIIRCGVYSPNKFNPFYNQ